MERRLLVAAALMIVAVVLSNLLFPPARPVPGGPEVSDSLPPPSEIGRAQQGGAATETVESPGTTGAVRGGEAAVAPPGGGEGLRAEAPERSAVEQGGDTIEVRGPLWRYRFTTRGAALIGATLPHYLSYAPGDSAGTHVELVRPRDHLFGYRIAAGADTLDLTNRVFEASASSVDLGDDPAAGIADSLTFTYGVPGTELRLRVVYRFRSESYLMEVSGRLEGLGDRGYTVLSSLGRGLRSNEANPKDDHAHLSYAVRDQAGKIVSGKLQAIPPGERTSAPGGPFGWVAAKSKYFLIAYVTPPAGPSFGGLLIKGNEEEYSADMEIALPVPAGDPSFAFRAYIGPQDFGRLSTVGQNLQDVNPYGWRWLRPVIRPLAGLITTFLVWMHETLNLAYGWVLMLFGLLMRVVLFPLYQKSMRAQLAQQQVQPLIKDLQAKYKDDPQKQQQEMMRLYKEHKINPLAGCLPMLIPYPVLITLFFVFQNTIEVRGVPFLWLPDLSLADPLYIIPVLMGLSMYLLTWIGQRGVEPNPQMKMMGYAMPIGLTFLFLKFPAGLNLYYATSNFASLPQQLYLARERKKAKS
ncbi:MAG: membrane protein insertase YidC [Gemmatimonadota bacterium]